MKQAIELLNNRIRLRLLEERDLVTTLSWRNDELNRKWFFSKDIITLENHLNWFRSYKGSENDYVFVAELIEAENRIIGQGAVYHIDHSKKCGEVGRILIGDHKQKGKGFGKEVIDLIVQFAFINLRLNSLYAEIIPENSASLRVFSKCGFTQIGWFDDRIRMELQSFQSDNPNY